MTTILTDGVYISHEAGQPPKVIIELVEVEPGSEVAALLAKAWAQLGQAISANKAPSPEPGHESAVKDGNSAEEQAPGTGAWWSQ